VLDADNKPLQRYELNVERVIDPGPAFLLNRALQLVVAEGTGRSLNRRFSGELGLAGKTGTTNDLRDSWFAGFDGEKLAVVWMGRDDNQPMGLTGASGAMQVWGDLFSMTGATATQLLKPENVAWHGVDRESGGLADKGCENTVQLAFIESGLLPEPAPCARTGGPDWLPEWMQ
jgi:penicillin-binding protein 1B